MRLLMKLEKGMEEKDWAWKEERGKKVMPTSEVVAPGVSRFLGF